MSIKDCLDRLSGLCSMRVLWLGTMILMGRIVAEARDSKPTEEQQRIIKKQVDELTRPFGSGKKKEAIEKLFDASRDASIDSDERYVVLTTLISLTREAGDAEHWLEAVHALLDSYDLDRDKELTSLFLEFLKTAKPGTALQPVVEGALLEIELAIGEDRFSDAGTLLAAAGEAIRKGQNDKLKAAVTAARQAFSSREKEWKEFEAAKEKLTTQNDNPALNSTVGRWYAVQKQDWPQALPYLEKGSDATWKAAAVLEQTAPTGANEETAVGNAWYEIGIKETGPKRTALLLHAGDWYERAEPNAGSVLLRQHLADRLAEIAKLNQPVAAPVRTPAADTNSLPVGEWIDLMPKIDLADHAIVGNWKRLPGSGGLVCDEFRYNSRVMAPVVVTGSFELQCSFIRRSGSEAVGLIWPVGNTACVLQLDAWKGTVSGLELVDGKQVKELVGTSSSVARPTPLINGKSHSVHVKVASGQEKASIEATLDDRTIVNWQGKTSQLAMSGAHSLPIPNSVGIIVLDASLELRELKVKLVRGARGSAAGRGFWLGDDWKNPLHEVADRPSRDLASKCLDWNGRKYLFVREAMSLPKAYLLAERVKGRLLTISSKEEEKMILANGRDQTYWLSDWHPTGGIWRDERNRPLRYKALPGPAQPNMFPWEWKAALNTLPSELGVHDVPCDPEYCVCIEWGEEYPD